MNKSVTPAKKREVRLNALNNEKGKSELREKATQIKSDSEKKNESSKKQ